MSVPTLFARISSLVMSHSLKSDRSKSTKNASRRQNSGQFVTKGGSGQSSLFQAMKRGTVSHHQSRRYQKKQISTSIEVCEQRVLLAGVQAPWTPLGPFSATDGQVENLGANDEVVGAISSVAAHPTNADILYVGAVNGGVWKTTNATATSPNWTPQTDDLASQSIGALTFDLADATSNTLYAGNGRYSSFAQVGNSRNGLLRTTDGGQNWAVVNGGGTLTGKNISGIYANGNTIVVSVNIADSFTFANIGIFRSTDGGASFSQVSVGDGTSTGLPDGLSYDLVVDPSDNDTLYAPIAFSANGTNGVYKSTDAGASWTKVSSAAMDALFTTGASNVEMAVGNSNEVYAAIIITGNLEGLFRSPDGGTTWVQMDSPSTNENGTDVGLNPKGFKGPLTGTPEEIAGGQGNIHFSIVADPNNANVVYVGGDRQPRTFGDTGGFPNSIGARDFSGRLFRGDASLALGSQFVHLTHSDSLGAAGGGTANSSSPHADSRDMTFDANGNIIEVDDGGVYRRSSPQNDTGDWFSVIGNLQITEAHDVAWDALSNVAITGNQDTGTTYQTAEGVAQWDSLHTGDGGDVGVDNIELAGSNQSVRYTSFQVLQVFRRTVWDAAGNLLSTSFPSLTPTGGSPSIAGAFRTPVETNSVAGGRLLIQGGNSLFESLNGGTTVTEIGAGLGVSSIFSNALWYGGAQNGTDNADVVWAASGSDVFVRTAGTGDVVQTTGDPSSGTIRDLAVNSDDFTNAFVNDSNQVFSTDDTGANWSDVTGNLLSFASDIRSLSFVSTTVNDVILAGTNAGLFAANLTNLGTWVEIGLDLPNVLVFDVDYDAGDDILVAGTMGRGAWSLTNASTNIDSAFSVNTDSLSVTIDLTSVSENGGSATGTVTRSGSTTGAVVVTLSSDDITEATVPVTVTILDGNSSATFAITAVDDALVDGTQTVNITATAIGLDNGTQSLDVTDDEVAILSLTIDQTSISENGGTATGTVTRNSGTSGDQIVNLSSDDTGEATVPTTVVIQDGQNSATFPITAVDDAIIDGTQTVLITAATAGFINGTETVDVTDDDAAALDVSIDLTSISEAGGSATGTVSRNSGTTGDLVVTLNSNDTTEATVPASVTILDGQTSVTFTITAIDDGAIDGTQIATITATAAGHTDGTQTIEVLDDDTNNLSLTIDQASISENGGTATGTITRLPDTTGDLVVTLSSSDTGEATVPATVTILDGRDFATFTITGVDDAILDGTQTVTITASAAGLLATTRNLGVVDDENTSLSVTINQTSIPENGGFATGTVTRFPNSVGDLLVALISSDTSEATVPVTVTILDGQFSATFQINAVDDAIADGTQVVTVTASAIGLTNGTEQINVTDDEIIDYNFVRLDALGSQVFADQNRPVALTGPADEAIFEFYGQAGELFSAVITPSDPNAIVTLEIVELSQAFSSTTPGQPLVVSGELLPISQFYHIRITSSVADTVELDSYLNATLEQQIFGGDSSIILPVAIDNSLIDFGVQRYAILGNDATTGDFYTIDLSGHVGEKIEIILEGLTQDFGAATLELQDQFGTTLATASAMPLGVDPTNFDLAIFEFDVLAGGIHRLVVSSPGVAGEYLLTVITQTIGFDHEPNNASTDTLREITGLDGVTGYVGVASRDIYTVTLNAGNAIILSTSTPLDDPLGTPLNSLDPFLTIRNPDGSFAASDDNSASDGKNVQLSFVATQTGLYEIDLSSLSGEGEYIITFVINQGPDILPETFTVPENSPVGTVVGTPTATDPDGSPLVYAIVGGNPGNTFAIDSMTGEITVNNSALLDFETLRFFDLLVQVTDDGTPALSDVATIHIDILNLADGVAIPFFDGFESYPVVNPPGNPLPPGSPWITNSTHLGRSRVTDLYQPFEGNKHLLLESSVIDNLGSLNEVTLEVNSGGADQIFLEFAEREFLDEDHPMSAMFTGSEDSDGVAISADGNTWYRVVSLTGITSTTQYQEFSFNLTALAAEVGISLTGSFYVKLQQFDNFPAESDGIAFDNVRILSRPLVNLPPVVQDQLFYINENPIPGLVVGNAQATDPNAGDTKFFEIISGNDTATVTGVFSIDPMTGAIRVEKPEAVDFETNPVFRLGIQVTDSGTPGLTDTAEVTIQAKNVVERDALFFDNFEDGTLDKWTTVSDNLGRIQNTTGNGPAQGTNHLTFDSSSNSPTNSRNEATFTFDGMGYKDIMLSMYQREFNDEDHPLPELYAGSVDGDGISISVDGTTWYRVESLVGPDSTETYQQRQYDLSALAAQKGLSLQGTVYVKLQAYDNFEIPFDGMAFDDVLVDGVPIGPAPPAAAQGLAGLAIEGGQLNWYVTSQDGGVANGLSQAWGTVGPASQGVLEVKTGDFNGDGRDDVALLNNGGEWWIGLSTGSQFDQFRWTQWDVGTTFSHVDIGDFNGDGRDDLAGLDSNGNWRVAESQGNVFTTRTWVKWKATGNWNDIQIGDFNNDGKDDIAGRRDDGRWWVAQSDGTQFQTTNWGRWNSTSGWQDVSVGDFNGDGLADITGRTSSGRWWTLLSQGNVFASSYWGKWSATGSWNDVVVGDFDGDGKDDVAGRRKDGKWWVGQSQGNTFVTSFWGQWSSTGNWNDVVIGDFNADGKADIAGRDNNGLWLNALSQGNSFLNQAGAQWDAALTWVAVTVGAYNAPPIPITPPPAAPALAFGDGGQNSSPDAGSQGGPGLVYEADASSSNQANQGGSSDSGQTDSSTYSPAASTETSVEELFGDQSLLDMLADLG